MVLAPQEGMGFGIELGVVEVGNFRLLEMELDQGEGYWIFQQAASGLLLVNQRISCRWGRAEWWM